MSVVVDTVAFAAAVIGGLIFGYKCIEPLAHHCSDEAAPSETDQTDVSVNLAILYGTIALVLSAVVSEWPPEGQTIPWPFGDIVFFGSTVLGAIIIGRVTRLIVRVEQQLS